MAVTHPYFVPLQPKPKTFLRVTLPLAENIPSLGLTNDMAQEMDTGSSLVLKWEEPKSLYQTINREHRLRERCSISFSNRM